MFLKVGSDWRVVARKAGLRCALAISRRALIVTSGLSEHVFFMPSFRSKAAKFFLFLSESKPLQRENQ